MAKCVLNLAEQGEGLIGSPDAAVFQTVLELLFNRVSDNWETRLKQVFLLSHLWCGTGLHHIATLGR